MPDFDEMCRRGDQAIADEYYSGERGLVPDLARIAMEAVGVPALVDAVERLRAALGDIAYDDDGVCDYVYHDGPRHMMDEDCPGASCHAKRTLTPPVTEHPDA